MQGVGVVEKTSVVRLRVKGANAPHLSAENKISFQNLTYLLILARKELSPNKIDTYFRREKPWLKRQAGETSQPCTSEESPLGQKGYLT